MDACEIYGLKHYARADKNLKQSFYLHYVMSQITLQSEISIAEETKTAKPVKEKKRDVKSKQKNLF